MPFMRIFLLLILAALCPFCRASVYYVDASAPGPAHDGTSWTSASTSVQAGLNAASPGDEVWVAAGGAGASAYVENLTMKDGVGLYGGFAGTETDRSQRDWSANVTVLDGNGTNRVIFEARGSGQAAVIDGFTIRNGNSTSNSGGGIFVAGTATVAHNRFIANAAYMYGGAIAVSGTAEIANNLIRGNSVAISGGGIAVHQGGKATVVANTIDSNYGASAGGGVYISSSSTRLSNNVISGNCASRGGGVYTYSGTTAILANDTITANNAGSGGGLYVVGATGIVTVVNTVIASNVGGIFRNGGTLTLRNNDVYGNALYDYYGLTDPTGSDGNISQDPALSSIYHDVHLGPGSPCIDAGDDSAVASSDTDRYGKPRIIGAHVDIGADESDGRTWTIPSRIWRVSPAGDDNNDGSTWNLAKKTVTGVLLSAQGGDEVWAARGIYVGNPTLPAGVALYGGFAGTETTRDQRNYRDNVTVLDADGKGKALFIPCTSWVADGFTIRHGSDTGVVLRGAGTLGHNHITGNQGTYGGGISAGTAGRVTIHNNVIDGNYASYGGGIYAGSGALSIVNNTIAGNTDGIYLNNPTGDQLIVNNIITSGYEGVELNAGTATLRHNDVYWNTRNYVGLPDPTGADGNIALDPLFIDVTYHGSTYGYPVGNCRLQAGSPCVDAGDDTAIVPPEPDLDGRPRISGAHADIGAYEFNSAGAPPFTVPEIQKALEILAGLTPAEPADLRQLNASGTEASAGVIDLLDAVKLARKVTGLDTNP